MPSPGAILRLAVAGLVLAPAAAHARAEAGVFRFHDPSILGTRLNLAVIAGREAEGRRVAHAVRAEIDRLDLLLNGRRPGSELFALNRSEAWTASDDLFAVIAAAEAMRTRTDGAYSARLGRVFDLWRAADDAPPDRSALARAAEAATVAQVELDPASRSVRRPETVRFALDSLAKGYIVDRAVQAGLAAGAEGLLLEIGGDIRCAGRSPDGGWEVEVCDLPADNAPAAELVRLTGGALATSGRGPRDRLIAGRRYSPTLSPVTGWPVEGALSASVTAPMAAEADALATACLVLGPEKALAFIDRSPGAALRLVADGSVSTSAAWRGDAQLVRTAAASWPAKWQALATFTAPRRQLQRDPDFRSPYMAMWITDLNNRPIRTLILVGTKVVWQKDNFIWWSSNRAGAERLVSVRSMSTSGAGIYNVFWNGLDDAGKPVPRGKYMIHVETSRERGKHTYRNLTVDFTEPKRFKQVLPPTEEGGGLEVTFDRY